MMNISKKIVTTALGILTIMSTQAFALHTVYFQVNLTFNIREQATIPLRLSSHKILLDDFYQDHLHQNLFEIPLGPYSVEIICTKTNSEEHASSTISFKIDDHRIREVDIFASCPMKGSTIMGPEDIKIIQKHAN
jgi:hypothetical protein